VFIEFGGLLNQIKAVQRLAVLLVSGNAGFKSQIPDKAATTEYSRHLFLLNRGRKDTVFERFEHTVNIQVFLEILKQGVFAQNSHTIKKPNP